MAYRYFDLRMNIVPLFNDRKYPTNLWHDTIHWWVDPAIKVRFVESDDRYWFVMGSESQKPETNLYFFKELPKSKNYERFKELDMEEKPIFVWEFIKKRILTMQKNATCVYM